MARHLDATDGSGQGKASVPAVDDPRWQHGFVHVHELRLHYVEAGAGPLVLLLHGFPEFWYGWRRQILPLAAAGYRVVAPDLRGYNISDKPRETAAYGVRQVALDVRDLITSLGETRASVVGHDWGAAVAWSFAMQHPQALVRLAIMNGPHPLRMLQGLTPKQLLESWYMFFFQLPWLPERVLEQKDHALLFAAFDALPAHAQLTPVEREAYRAAFQQPGALGAMLNYYRAMLRPSEAVRLTPIEAEVLVLWGEEDPYLGRELAAPSPLWVPRAHVQYFPGVGHFIQHERAEEVNQRLIQFLNGARESGPAPA